MQKRMRKIKLFAGVLAILMVLSSLFSACTRYTEPVERENVLTTTSQAEQSTTTQAETSESQATKTTTKTLSRNGSYTSKDDVALYLHLYGELPENFITKKQAQELGWNGGSLEPYAPGKSIGGDYFGNYEGNLPKAKGRSYQECDIDTKGKSSRGPKRIVYSNDGLIYYTGDHYDSFELLYGEE